MFQILGIGILAAVIVAFVLPRVWGLRIGCFLLLLGVGVPLFLWGVVEARAHGESAAGMLGTILFLLFAPPGFVLTVIAALAGRE
ncbi:MAG: hypothetical protein NTW86_33200 [Candidatus Sumerlaeota bacterium]|nr:hypothetical protein [Candidatus Sumerlaeota bacterium]